MSFSFVDAWECSEFVPAFESARRANMYLTVQCFCTKETTGWGENNWILRKSCDGLQLSWQSKMLLSFDAYLVMFEIARLLTVNTLTSLPSFSCTACSEDWMAWLTLNQAPLLGFTVASRVLVQVEAGWG